MKIALWSSVAMNESLGSTLRIGRRERGVGVLRGDVLEDCSVLRDAERTVFEERDVAERVPRRFPFCFSSPAAPALPARPPEPTTSTRNAPRATTS